MRKLLCLILALSIAILCAASALADGLLQIVPEIASEQSSNKPEKPKPEKPKPEKPAEVVIDIPTLVEPSNSGHSSSGSSGSSSSSSSGNGSSPSKPSNNNNTNTNSGGGSTELPAMEIIIEGDVPLGAGIGGGPTNAGSHANTPAASTNVSAPSLNLDPAVTLQPVQEGIEENDITEVEVYDDATHALRIVSSLTPGSVVHVGDRVELKAIPMGFAGVNYKIQWQTAQVDENGNMGEFHNIPGAFGITYTIVFNKDNLNDHWRAAIKIVK